MRNKMDALGGTLDLELKRRAALIEATRGFMPADEGRALAQAFLRSKAPLVLPGVEIGSYLGLSTIYLGAAALVAGRGLMSIDHHRGSEELQPGWGHHDPHLMDPVANSMDSLYLFRRTIDLAGLSDTVAIVAAESAAFARIYFGEISFLFIDGGHSHHQAHSDFDSWVPKIAKGGVLAIHDVFPDPADGGRPPYELFKRALEQGFTNASATGSLRVMTREGGR